MVLSLFLKYFGKKPEGQESHYKTPPPLITISPMNQYFNRLGLELNRAEREKGCSLSPEEREEIQESVREALGVREERRILPRERLLFPESDVPEVQQKSFYHNRIALDMVAYKREHGQWPSEEEGRKIIEKVREDKGIVTIVEEVEFTELIFRNK